MATEAPDADFLAAERLVERYARTLEPPRDASPVEVDDDVQFTVYRPRAARPERTERLVAFAHKSDDYEEDGRLVDPAIEVARQAEEVLGDLSGQVTTTQDADAPIARGDMLRFVPVVPGIRVQPRGAGVPVAARRAPRGLRVPGRPHLDGQTLFGRLSVYVGLRLVADVTLRIRVDSTARRRPRTRSRGRVYGKVFPSYSHQDAVVVAQIAAAAQTLGHEYLRDVDQLRAGQDWQRELERYIEQADIFQLFWSPASMMSPHVQHEWDYALSLNRPDFVRPVYWEQPRRERAPESPAARARPVALRLPRRIGTRGPRAHGACTRAGCFAAPVVLDRRPPRRSRHRARRGVGCAQRLPASARRRWPRLRVTAALASGGAPSASPPPAATVSASATPDATGDAGPVGTPPATSVSASPVRPPSSEAARAVVVEFFGALDGGDVDAAADLVCPDYLAELGDDLDGSRRTPTKRPSSSPTRSRVPTGRWSSR